MPPRLKPRSYGLKGQRVLLGSETGGPLSYQLRLDYKVGTSISPEVFQILISIEGYCSSKECLPQLKKLANLGAYGIFSLERLHPSSGAHLGFEVN